VSFLR
jgi:hypothetical protein